MDQRSPSGRPSRGLLLSRELRLSRGLLSCGVAAAPLFVSAFLVEGATRDGYDARRHPVSSLSLGPHGWSQRANFLATGSLFLAEAAGLWLDPAAGRSSRPGGRAGPILVGSIGLGLVGAGIFPCDPVSGYPPDIPAGTQTTSGRLHDLCSTPVFLCLPAATVVYARTFARAGRWWWMATSVAAGVTQFATFALAGAGFSQRPGYVDHAGLFQRASLIAGFGWLSALAARRLADQRR